MTDDELRRLAEAATPGPWSHSPSRGEAGRGFEAQVWDANGEALLFFSDGRTIGAEADANAAFIAAAREAVPLLLDRVAKAEAGWQPIETAPRDKPILAWCDHEADPYVEDKEVGRLTLYAAHHEGMSHASTGWHIVEWGGAFGDASYEDFHQPTHLPDWWFVAGSEFEVAANPTHWRPLPAAPEPTP